MKKKLNTYLGRLSAAQIADGMNAAMKNARRLSEDAAILLAAGRFPTAASIAVLSIEEAGKVSILRALALAVTDEDAAKHRKGYRSHTRKNVMWQLPELAAAGARKLDDFRGLLGENSDHPFFLDQIKQLGFYTDCLGKAHWVVPADVIDENLAQGLVQIAKLFAHDEEQTKKEIELWIDHLGPVWGKNLSWMKRALMNWYAAMQAAGLAGEGPNGMEGFVRDGLG